MWCLFHFRDQWTASKDDGLIMIVFPEDNPFSRCRSNWEDCFNEGVDTRDSVILYGDYKSASEMVSLPDHIVISRELNACCYGRNHGGKLFCLSSRCLGVIDGGMKKMMIQSEKATTRDLDFSLRFTLGMRSILADQNKVNKMITKGIKKSSKALFG